MKGRIKKSARISKREMRQRAMVISEELARGSEASHELIQMLVPLGLAAVGEQLSTEELFPYAVEGAIKMGIKPTMAAKRGTVASWLESVRQNMAVVWGKVTGKPGSFKAQDLVDLAFGIAQMENPESAGAMRDALRGTNEADAGAAFGLVVNAVITPKSLALGLKKLSQRMAQKPPTMRSGEAIPNIDLIQS